jgi:CRISPR-associated protein Cmr3
MTAANSRTTLGIHLEPLDVLFFRDGRPFDPSSRLSSGLPGPQTTAGALRTFLLREAGCDFGKLGESMKQGETFEKAAERQGASIGAVAGARFRGPWFTKERELLFPMPAVLHAPKDAGVCAASRGFIRLSPLKEDLPGWKPPSERLRPLWRQGGASFSFAGGYLTRGGLQEFLEGKVPGTDQCLTESALLDWDPRIGIGINPGTLATDKGILYAVEFLALKKGVGLYLEVSGPEDALGPLKKALNQPVDLPLGGEGRRVLLTADSPAELPSAKPSGKQKPLLVLLSPGLFGGAIPKALNGSLVAAAVPGEVAVSGWDMAKGGPKPCRFAAAAGSVYFLDNPLNPPGAWRQYSEDAELGWGTFAEGVWNND